MVLFVSDIKKPSIKLGFLQRLRHLKLSIMVYLLYIVTLV